MSESARREALPIARRGVLIVLSSPSGAGKSTIARELLASEPELTMSVSATTRPPRVGEVNGRDYLFVDTPTFQELVRTGGLLEHATVFGNHYGTPRAPVDNALSKGRDILFDIDWQGARQLRTNIGNDLVSVFILPPSHAELERRLRTRGQDDATTVSARMAEATGEMSHWHEYDYVVVNNDATTAVAQVRAILMAERLRERRQIGLASFVSAISST